MSLFKSREWWSVDCGTGEETFDGSHLCLASVSYSENTQKQLIIVGSRQGYLRIYDPQRSSEVDTNVAHSSDMLLETQLNFPILSVQSGRFSNTDGAHLAVLHPRKLSVVRINVISDNSDQQQLHTHCSLDPLYEHDLKQHSYSMCVGPFWICVQSLSGGILSFFEYEQAGMICRLPAIGFLPSSLCYLKTTDSFVVVDSTWNLLSYSYHSLANMAVHQQQAAGDNKILTEWELELGEPALDIQQSGSFIVVLGERHIFCLNDSGLIHWVKRLDYHPMCCTLQIPPNEPENVVVLICSDASTLLVYKSNAIEWNCKLPVTPLAIQIGTFQSLPGLIVLLSETGRLSVCYMGTQQVQYSFCLPPQRSFNYQRGLKEIEQLKRQIANPGKPEIESSNKIEIALLLDQEPSPEYSQVSHQAINVFKGHLRITTVSVGELHVGLGCGSMILATPSTVFIEDQKEAWIPVQFHQAGRSPASSLDCKVVAVAANQSQSRTFSLPLQLAMRVAIPVREALVKITLAIDQPAVSLSLLFKDFSGVDESMSNVVAFAHLGNGVIVSILFSKSANKYRLQSDSLAALALPVVELQRRLLLHIRSDLRISLDSAPPVQELWNLVEHHYSAQIELQNEMTKLNQASRQFQVIQRVFHNKILQTKTNDATGSFTALQLANDHVLFCIQQLERTQEIMQESTDSLEAAIRCVISLFTSDSKKTQQALLLSKALLPVEPWDSKNQQMWQKIIETRLSYILRRWGSSAGQLSDNKEFSMSSLKKVFYLAFDILFKGSTQ